MLNMKVGIGSFLFIIISGTLVVLVLWVGSCYLDIGS